MNHEETITLYHPMLHSIALKMLRCKEDAEDLVQDTFIKWLKVDKEKIQNTQAYLVTAITNTCINHLNNIKRKKEDYLENFKLPQLKNLLSESNLAHLDVNIELQEALSVVSTKLEPLERAVFLLKEIFNFDYESLQEVLDKKQEHCRQLFCRARKKLREETDKVVISSNKSSLFQSFLKAVNAGDFNDLITELKKDISKAWAK